MMTNENDTDPLTSPPREETDPNYAGRTGERVSYGAVSHSGSEAHLQTDPNFLTALKEPSVPQPPVVLIAGTPMPPAGKNDSIDELIDGLPLDAGLPKKSASAALPKSAVPAALLPPVIVDVKTEPPRHRKGRVDNSTVVTPAGLELKTQRWVTAGIAVAIGLGILVWTINWSTGPSRHVEEPEITTMEAQHPVNVPPTMAPMMTAPLPPVTSPFESPPLMHAPPTSAAPPNSSASGRPPRAPPSVSAQPDINEFKPSIRH